MQCVRGHSAFSVERFCFAFVVPLHTSTYSCFTYLVYMLLLSYGRFGCLHEQKQGTTKMAMLLTKDSCGSKGEHACA